MIGLFLLKIVLCAHDKKLKYFRIINIKSVLRYLSRTRAVQEL